MSSQRPTVLDVAKAAGVGASTVSRCLRGERYVTPEVCRRVLEAVAKIGYEPNEVARSLRNGRTRSIGIVFPQIANSFFSQCVQEIEREATQHGCSVILLTHQENPETQSKQLSTLRRLRADGVILALAPGSDPERVRRELGGAAVVALDRPLWKEADSVTLENRQAAQDAARHLLEHGYKNIACVTANPEIYTFQQRIEGFRKTMASGGLRERVILASDYDRLKAEVQSTLLRLHRLEALISLSNMATFAVMQAIREVKHATGRQVALIGFDDVDFATLVNPSVSVMRQPTKLLAHHSVRLLFQRLHEGGGAEAYMARTITLPGELVRRGSCGCGAENLSGAPLKRENSALRNGFQEV